MTKTPPSRETTRRALFRRSHSFPSSRVFLRRLAGFETARVVSNETARVSRTASGIVFRSRERAAFGKESARVAGDARETRVGTALSIRRRWSRLRFSEPRCLEGYLAMPGSGGILKVCRSEG